MLTIFQYFINSQTNLPDTNSDPAELYLYQADITNDAKEVYILDNIYNDLYVREKGQFQTLKIRSDEGLDGFDGAARQSFHIKHDGVWQPNDAKPLLTSKDGKYLVHLRLGTYDTGPICSYLWQNGSVRVYHRTISEIIHERRPLTPDMAIRLAHFLGSTSESWLNMQQAVDSWELENENPKLYATIEKHLHKEAA